MYIALSVILLITFGWIIVWFYTLSTIKISTDNPMNTIIVSKVSKDSTTPVKVDPDKTSVNLRVSSGTYIVTVKNSIQTKTKIIKVNIAEVAELNMSLGDTITYPNPEPVTSFGATSIVASSTSMKFLDSNSANSSLHSIDASGNFTTLDNGAFYKLIKWSKSPDFGVGIGLDKSNNSYTIRMIDDGTIKIIKTPFKPNSYSSIGVSPNKSWFVSDGKSVYQGFSDGSFKKLFTTKDLVGIIAASDNAILLSSRKPGSIREGSLISLHTNGTTYQIEGGVYEAVWSPNGKKIILTGDTPGVFDDKLNKIDLTLDNNASGLAWLDDNTIVYGEKNKLMRFTISSGDSRSILSFQNNNNNYVVYNTLNESGDYLYITVQKGSLRTSINYTTYRVGLKNQPVIDVPLKTLNLLIPNTTYGCSLNFINFVKFSILMHAERPNVNCADVVQNYLGDYGVSMSNISLQQY